MENYDVYGDEDPKLQAEIMRTGTNLLKAYVAKLDPDKALYIRQILGFETVVRNAFAQAQSGQMTIQQAVKATLEQALGGLRNGLMPILQRALTRYLGAGPMRDMNFRQHIKDQGGITSLVGHLYEYLRSGQNIRDALRTVVKSLKQDVKSTQQYKTMGYSSDADGIGGFGTPVGGIDHFEHQLSKDCPAIFEWNEEKMKTFFG